MTRPLNAFKRALARGQAQTGFWCTIPGPVVAEALAVSGFDWIVIDTEHSPTDVPDTLGMMQAMAAHPVSAVVRPAALDTVLIKRLLDLGAQTLLIPNVNSEAEAQAAVAAMRYAPRGVRGVTGMSRASRYATVPDYMARAEEDLCLIVQIETAQALNRIEAIAAVDGVDGLFVGPADLAASMGHPGDLDHLAVQAAIQEAVRRIVAAGKPAGILATDVDAARRYIGWGTTFTAVGTDLSLLTTAARALSAHFRAG